MLNLTELGVKVFIKKAKNLTPFWENYNLVIWERNNGGYTSVKGMFRENTWGTAERIAVTKNGIWKLPVKYVKHFK